MPCELSSAPRPIHKNLHNYDPISLSDVGSAFLSLLSGHHYCSLGGGGEAMPLKTVSVEKIAASKTMLVMAVEAAE